jgi:hypothetical protein
LANYARQDETHNGMTVLPKMPSLIVFTAGAPCMDPDDRWFWRTPKLNTHNFGIMKVRLVSKPLNDRLPPEICQTFFHDFSEAFIPSPPLGRENYSQNSR